MNSHVIKVVAGGGKTTKSEQILRERNNGLYLAFTNSVVNSLKMKGYLCKTIDSLFTSFLIPRLIDVVPIICHGAKIEIINSSKELKQSLKGVANIKINEDGYLYNHNKRLDIDINIPNSKLHSMSNEPNIRFLKYIFGENHLRLTNSLRNDLSNYLVRKYSDEIIALLNSRFSYIIFDEAQDLKEYREMFAKILYESDIEIYVIGDDNQNLMGGGQWFETLDVNETQNQSYRCPDTNCKWIRDNLNIDIFGNSEVSTFQQVNINHVLELDDGSRFLLYFSKNKSTSFYIDSWKGPKNTIKSAKGSTINEDVVILGETLNKKSYYTAITRTKKDVFTTIKKVN